jgi:hypothetical protein
MHVVTSFTYVTENGTIFLRRERREPAWDGKPKGFYPYMADPASETGFARQPGLPEGIIVPLYHADELKRTVAAGGVVFLTEGEKKTDRLRAALATITAPEDAGKVCVISPFGRGDDDKHFTPHLAQLAGATLVVVWSDSSAKGREHANRRAQAIKAAHPHMPVKVLDVFPGREDDADAVEWLDGYAEDGLAPHDISTLQVLVDATPYVETALANGNNLQQ